MPGRCWVKGSTGTISVNRPTALCGWCFVVISISWRKHVVVAEYEPKQA